jgi:hypothetical protein
MKPTGVTPTGATATSNGRAAARREDLVPTTSLATAPPPAAPPVDPEVLEKPVRRHFTVRTRWGCCGRPIGVPGQVGAWLRREGLYSVVERSSRSQKSLRVARDPLSPPTSAGHA